MYWHIRINVTMGIIDKGNISQPNMYFGHLGVGIDDTIQALLSLNEH